MPLRDFVTGSQKNRIKAVGGATALILAAAAGLYSLKVEDPDGNNAISFSAYGVPCVGNPADCGESGEVLINQGGSGTALAWGTAGIDLTTTDARYVQIQGSTMTGALAIKVTSGTATGNTLVVDTKGLVYDATNKRVGIGTTSPGAKLSIKIPDTTTVPLIIESNDGTDILKLQQYANTARAQLQIGTYNGISTPNYSFVGDTNTGMAGGYLADTLQFVTNNTEKVRITSTGNVGIGTTSPTTALEVVGTMSGTTIFSGSGMILGDNDGVGCTQISCNDGNCTFSSLTCP